MRCRRQAIIVMKKISKYTVEVHSECLTKEALEGSGNIKLGGQIIHTVKYADDLVLLAKKEKVVQDMIDKIIEIGRCYRLEMDVEKTKVMRIS
jgi:GTP cyclohydrolase II